MSQLKSRRELALLATGGLVATTVAVGLTKPAQAIEGNMTRARSALGEALHFLEVADADKGGHRRTAMNLIKQAIGEVDQGIRFDMTH
jgi:hypothetical protein